MYLRRPVLSLMTKVFPLPAAFKDTCESKIPKQQKYIYFLTIIGMINLLINDDNDKEFV